MATSILAPVHPGEVLLEEFLEPLGLSQYRLAKDISVPPRRINEIVHGKRSVTADTALRTLSLFRNFRSILAQSPDRIRSGCGKGSAWR